MAKSSLADLGPMYKDVLVRGKQQRTFGITAEGIFYLIGSFPEIGKLLEGTLTSLKVEQVLQLAPSTLASLVAVGTTNRESYSTYDLWVEDIKATEKDAMRLSAPDQLALITGIFDSTFSEGAGPFVEQLKGMIKNLGINEAVNDLQGAPAAVGTPNSIQSPQPTRSERHSKSALQVGIPKHRIVRSTIPPEDSLPGQESSAA